MSGEWLPPVLLRLPAAVVACDSDRLLSPGNRS